MRSVYYSHLECASRPFCTIVAGQAFLDFTKLPFFKESIDTSKTAKFEIHRKSFLLFLIFCTKDDIFVSSIALVPHSVVCDYRMDVEDTCLSLSHQYQHISDNDIQSFVLLHEGNIT